MILSMRPTQLVVPPYSSNIKASIIDALKTSDVMSDGAMDKAFIRWLQIEMILKMHEFILNADIWILCSILAATANRILAGLAVEGKLTKCRMGGH